MHSFEKQGSNLKSTIVWSIVASFNIGYELHCVALILAEKNKKSSLPDDMTRAEIVKRVAGLGVEGREKRDLGWWPKHEPNWT